MEAQRYPEDYDGIDRRRPGGQLDAVPDRRAPLVLVRDANKDPESYIPGEQAAGPRAMR